MRLKKIWTAVVAGILALSITSCTQSYSTAQTDAFAIKGTDYTIEVNSYSFDKKPTPYMFVESESSFAFPARTLSELDKHMTDVFEGRIIRIEYLSIYGNPYMKLDIEVGASLKGNLVEGDAVSVVLYGGYISIADIVKVHDTGFRFKEVPESEWATTFFWADPEYAETPTIGTRYVFFTCPSGDFLPGAYSPMNRGMGVFKQTNNGTYARVPFDGEGSERHFNEFTLGELIEYYK